MRYLILLIITSLLSACLSINADKQAKSGPVLYDFGLPSMASKETVTSQLAIDAITAVDALNNNRIRYRLNYKNPAQVLTYTESRWTTAPAQLLSLQLRSLVKTSETPLSNCNLKIELDTFDHIFDSPTKSSAIVQMNAILIEKKSRKILASTMIEESATASSSDAKGGVAALTKASSIALQKAVTWGNTAVENAPGCH
ncbi:MAG: hypothetical protein ACAH12_07780 [Methylophilaceae bacterium]